MSATATLPSHPAAERSPARFDRSRSSRPTSKMDRPANSTARSKSDRPEAKEHDILFQKFFKSVGPRTYAAQVKRASNGNHYLVLTEGKRDDKTAELRKVRLFIYSEDFVEFFRLVKSTAEFIKENPVPDDVRQKQEKRWAKQAGATSSRR